MSRQSSDNDPSDGIIRRKRGRPRKQRSIQVPTGSVGKKRGRPPKALVEKRGRLSKALVEKKEEVNEPAHPRKRGRPRKDTLKIIKESIMKVATKGRPRKKPKEQISKRNQIDAVDSSKSRPKVDSKRGRPRKTLKEEIKELIPIQPRRGRPSKASSTKESTDGGLRKRGRPRKTPAKNNTVQIKKRGRPPKARVSEESQTGAVRRKRGRPRKNAVKPNKSPETTKNDEDDDSSSIADFSELLSDEDDEEEPEPSEDYHFSHSPGKMHRKRIKLFKKYREQNDIDYDFKTKKGKGI